MDFLGAMSGFERIAIIGGAMLMAYWGFRLFAIARAPGYVFMGLGAALLIGTLMTGGTHPQALGESYQLAAADEESMPEADAKPAEPRSAPATTKPRDPSQVGDPEETKQETLIAEAEVEPKDASPALELAARDDEVTADDAPANQLLLSSEELGGRIVSVKSESVTLEWSREG